MKNKRISLIDKYIGGIIFKAVLLSLLFLTTLLMVFFFIDDMPNIGRGSYTMSDALINLLLNIPDNLLYIFPMSALVGAIVGLGSLSSTSELIVIRATGISTWHIIKSALLAILPLLIIVMMMGEWLSPVSKQYAQQRRSLAFSNGQLISSGAGLWARDGDDFIHIKHTLPEGKVEGLERYKFDQNMVLDSITRAESGEYVGKGIWHLQNVHSTIFKADKIVNQQLDETRWKSELTLENLGMASLDPASLGIAELWRYANYLQRNQLDAGQFLLSFWRKILQPFSIAVMLILGCSFVFSSLRHTGLGARTLSGILIGLAYYLVNESMGSVAIAYHMPAFAGAVMPVIVFIFLARWRLKKVN